MPEQTEFDIGYTSTESACPGGLGKANVQVHNNSDSDGRARIQIVSAGINVTSDPVFIEAQGNWTASGEYFHERVRMPPEDTGITIRAQAEREDGWETTETTNESLNPEEPAFAIDALETPSRVQPGTTDSARYRVQNIGNCSGNVQVSTPQAVSTGTSLSLAAGQSTTVTTEFEMGGTPLDFTVQIENVETGETSSLSAEVGIRRAILLDTTGSVEYVGGFNKDIAYQGLLVGSEFGTEDLEEEDVVIPGIATAEFDGIVGSSKFDRDTISYDSLKYFTVETTEEISFVKNGEFKEMGTSFEFNNSSLPSKVYRRRNIGMDEPDITISTDLANPKDRMGRLMSFRGAPTIRHILGR